VLFALLLCAATHTGRAFVLLTVRIRSAGGH